MRLLVWGGVAGCWLLGLWCLSGVVDGLLEGVLTR